MTTKAKTKPAGAKGQPLVVTTLHKGVFHGYGNPKVGADKTITLAEAQMCVYWSADMCSVLGLASNGPSSSCKISKPIPSITLTDVTSVMVASEAAADAWRKAPWA